MLQAGGAGLFGLTLPKVLAAEAVSGVMAPRAKSVIFLFLFGGPSQLETFDLKPDAPSTIRGPFKPIASRTPELRIGEMMPRLAGMSDKFCVIRTMTHPYNDHSTGAHYIQTGRPWHVPIGGGFNATEKDWPAYGSVVDYLDRQRRRSRRPRYAGLSSICPTGWGTCRRTPRSSIGRGNMPVGWAAATTRWPRRIGKRDDKDNPYFRTCSDEELKFQIQGLALSEGLSLDRLEAPAFAGRRVRRGRGATWIAAEPRLRTISFGSARWRWSAPRRFAQALDIRREPAKTRDRLRPAPVRPIDAGRRGGWSKPARGSSPWPGMPGRL